MRNLAFFVVLMGFSACAAPKFSAASIYGSWRVTEVICQACGGPVLSLKGKLIVIGTDRIMNPAGDDCQSPPGLGFIKEVGSSELAAGPGASWPQSVDDAVAAHPRIFYGFVTCGGINYMRIALVSTDSGFYFVEGNIALALTRVK